VVVAEVDQANAAFYENLAADEFAKGNVAWGIYFLDAADFYAEPTPATVTARIYLLDAAMDKLSERTEQR
jgi:hypothetical protein